MRPAALTLGLVALGCSTQHDSMNAVPDSSTAAVQVPSTVDGTDRAASLPAIDRLSAEIIANGRYETATFAMG